MKLNESHRAFYKFTVKLEDNRILDCYYPTRTELKRCVTPIFGKFEVLDEEPLPLVVTQEMIDSCPKTAIIQASNSTWSYDFYRRVLNSGAAIPILSNGWVAYLVKDEELFNTKCKEGIPILSTHYFSTKSQPGDRIYWQDTIIINPKESKKMFESQKQDLVEKFFERAYNPHEEYRKDTINRAKESVRSALRTLILHTDIDYAKEYTDSLFSERPSKLF